MRRARIKAVATVPVRRKVVQDSTATESSEKTDEHEAKGESVAVLTKEKVEEFNVGLNSVTASSEINGDGEVKITELKTPERPLLSPVNVTYSVKYEDKVTTPKTPERITMVKESQVLVPERETSPAPVNDNQRVAKVTTIQKCTTPSVEGSPIKTYQSRSCFMRPTPRLDGGGRIRRNSVQGSGASASESEDDCKRVGSIGINHIRNDSVCSIQSVKDIGNIGNIAKLNLGQKRRMVVSESARKLAEARREFHLKHENKTPDKSSLTMYDLIYYNPITNPMKSKSDTQISNTRKMSVSSTTDKKDDGEEEDTVDEPPEMVVPQVKVGPNGHLIIDEQSLVIDQYKAQENIDRSDIIIDEDTSGNGFYKKRTKSKDWTKWDMMKFYKALSTYGTDFLLMQSVFPDRTRLELKAKYKKEERLNRELIEKALQYQEFNTEALEKDLANFEENERKELELSKLNVQEGPVPKKRRRCRAIIDEVNCDDDYASYANKKSDDDSSAEVSVFDISNKGKKCKSMKRKISKRRRRPIKIDDDDEDKDDDASDTSDREFELYEIKRTRSGRICKKMTKLQEPIKTCRLKNNRKTKMKLEKANEKECSNRNTHAYLTDTPNVINEIHEDIKIYGTEND